MNENIILSPISIERLTAIFAKVVGVEVDKKLDEKLNGMAVRGTRLIGIKDVMSFLDVSRTSVYKYIHNGQLTSYKVGGSVRFKEADVLALIKK